MRLPKPLQITRRTVQVLVLLLTIAIPVMARYANYLSSRQLDKTMARMDGGVQGAALQATDALLLTATGLERPEGSELRGAKREELLHAARTARGSVWSLELFGWNLTDPLAAFESAAASRGFTWVLVLGVLIPIAVTILLGRVFCSWICPAGLLFELGGLLRKLFGFLELKPGNVRLWHGDKFVLLGLGLALSLVLGLPVLGYLYPPALVGREAHNGITVMFDRAEEGMLGFSAAGLTLASWFLVGIVLAEAAFGRRLWCRALCPGGALYTLLGRFRLVRVRREASKCTKCGECVIACEMGLSPMTDRIGSECDNCGVCVARCGDDALGFHLTAREHRGAEAPARSAEPEEALR